MFFKPNFDRILAKKIVEKEQKTYTGIEFKTEADVEKALVIDVSKQLENTSEIKVGFTIFYEPQVAINLPKENLIVIKEIDILGFESNN